MASVFMCSSGCRGGVDKAVTQLKVPSERGQMKQEKARMFEEALNVAPKIPHLAQPVRTMMLRGWRNRVLGTEGRRTGV